MRTIELNSLQLNAVTINSAGERWRGSHAGAPPVVPDIPEVPEEPDIPEEPDVPSDPDVDENGYIIFADPEVARICAENWGDGVGITLEQAAAVTSVGDVFLGNTTVRKFNEFKHFSSVTMLGGTGNYDSGFALATSLQEVTLPSSLNTIGRRSFRNCSALEVIRNADGVKVVLENAFEGASRMQTFEGAGVELIKANAFLNCASLKDIATPNVITIGDQSNYPPFEGCEELKEADIRSVKILGKRCFMNTPLEGKMVLRNLTSMYSDAFQGTNISYFIAPVLSALPASVFVNCAQLSVVLLGKEMTTIGGYRTYETFKNCTALSALICLAATPPSLHANAFRGDSISSGSGSIYVPDASVEAYKTATNWNAYASRIFPISQLATNNPELYAEIEEYL